LDWGDLAVGLGLVLVIEGLLLALIPERLAQTMLLLLREPVNRLRWTGVAGAAVGLLIVWLIRS